MASRCKKCGATIIWIQTQEGKWMPCDEGMVEYRAGKTSDYEDRIVKQNGEVIRCTFDFQGKPDGVGRIPHWATCPFADDFRR